MLSPLLQRDDSQTSLFSWVTRWNSNYPFDYRWRKKRGISFGTEEHLKMNFIDMVIEMVEDSLAVRVTRELKEDKEREEDRLIEPGRLLRASRRFQEEQMDEDELDYVFENFEELVSVSENNTKEIIEEDE